MEIIITQQALDSYLDLVSRRAFTRQEYLAVIRPDVMRLKGYPEEEKFQNGKFWSPASGMNGRVISDGYKMKWHQIGDGKVQLRLTVGVFDNEGFLCEAYVKKDEKTDKRKLAKFKGYLELIRRGHCIIRGRLV